MPEVKSGPYEILVRFMCEKGEAFGQIRGVHRVMHTCLVNDDGTIVMREGETAKDFPADQIASTLGKQFADFLAQLEGEQAAHAETKKKHDEALSELGQSKFDLKTRTDALSELGVQHQNLRKAHADLSQLHQDLTKRHVELQEKSASTPTPPPTK